MTDLEKISVVWSEIQKHKELTLQQLKEAIKQRKPEILEELEDILIHLHKLYMIDYDGTNIKIPQLIDPDILTIPCLGCDKIKTCKPGSKNNPFRCEKFVKWFIKKFTE